MTPESHWITRYKKAGLVPNGVVTPALIDRLKHGHWFGSGITDRELDDLVARRGDWSYAAFVSAIFDLYGKRRNKPLVGDKTPSHVRSIPTLHRFFPDAKIVHIIRDGRDVTLSLLDWPKAVRVVGRFSTWSDDPVSTSVLWWEWSVRRGREAAAGAATRPIPGDQVRGRRPRTRGDGCRTSRVPPHRVLRQDALVSTADAKVDDPGVVDSCSRCLASHHARTSRLAPTDDA